MEKKEREQKHPYLKRKPIKEEAINVNKKYIKFEVGTPIDKNGNGHMELADIVDNIEGDLPKQKFVFIDPRVDRTKEEYRGIRPSIMFFPKHTNLDKIRRVMTKFIKRKYNEKETPEIDIFEHEMWFTFSDRNRIELYIAGFTQKESHDYQDWYYKTYKRKTRDVLYDLTQLPMDLINIITKAVD